AALVRGRAHAPGGRGRVSPGVRRRRLAAGGVGGLAGGSSTGLGHPSVRGGGARGTRSGRRALRAAACGRRAAATIAARAPRGAGGRAGGSRRCGHGGGAHGVGAAAATRSRRRAIGRRAALLVRTLALALDVKFQRIQFTPDLMPADITGVTLLSGAREFTFRPGPIFADLVLADEINRAPAKTQAALLEAMQERTVTVDGVGHPLSATFTVFATQNPVEFEGTYPLPEAELDRFMAKVLVGYPDSDAEQGVLERTVQGFEADRPATYGVSQVTDAAGLERLRAAVEAVRVASQITAYIAGVVRATRE